MTKRISKRSSEFNKINVIIIVFLVKFYPGQGKYSAGSKIAILPDEIKKKNKILISTERPKLIFIPNKRE